MTVQSLAINNKNLADHVSQFVGTSVVVAAGDFVNVESPYPDERQLVSNAVASRRAEFFSGRYYARQALRQLGHSDISILRGEKGNPLWPSGVIGSITHDLGHVVVAAMTSGSHRGLGIDLLLDPSRVEQSLQPLIAGPVELAGLANYNQSLPALALAFSLKESVVKAISPGIDRYLDLMDIELSIHGGKITAYLSCFDIGVPCGFINVQGGLFSFAFLPNS